MILLIGIISILSLVVFVQNTGKSFPRNANGAPIVSNKLAHLDEQNTLLEESYTFRIGDKLIGNGIVKLSLGKNKFTGTTIGIGKTTSYKIDFNTNIVGVVNDTNRYIDLTISGIGDPQGMLIPGTISYYGPLKGSFQNKKIRLSGKINIKGLFARFARFKKVEDIIIEIPYQSFAKTVK